MNHRPARACHYPGCAFERTDCCTPSGPLDETAGGGDFWTHGTGGEAQRAQRFRRGLPNDSRVIRAPAFFYSLNVCEQHEQVCIQLLCQQGSWDVYPYSESSTAFRLRVITAIETIMRNHVGRRVAVVCHGGVINAYVSHVIGLSHDVLFRPAHISISIIAAAGGIQTLYTLNEVHHLSTDEGDFRSV